jgi:hypothetical protein
LFFLAKPVTLEQLMECIEQHTGAKDPGGEPRPGAASSARAAAP